MKSLVDTNLFHKIKIDSDGIHDKFLNALGDEAFRTSWLVPPFGWLEYLGISTKGLLGVTVKDDKYVMSPGEKAANAKLIEVEGEDFVEHLQCVRTQARAAFDAKLSRQTLDKAIAEDRKYHSKAFTDGPFAEVLFDFPAKNYPASDLCELLTIDYLHRFPNFPRSMATGLRRMQRAAIVAEYYFEKRNVNLFRGVKQAWLARVKGDHEKIISEETLTGIEKAIADLKPGADRFDHDWLAYFLLGFATDGEFQPVVVYTQDDPNQVMHRLAVFFCVIQAAWEDCQSFKEVGPVPFMRTSRFCFVGDDGKIECEITSSGLVEFMVTEKLLVST